MRIYRMLLLYAAILVLLTGCHGWLNSIPKDTVMIKKIGQENKNREMEYEGILSQDAVKTVSVQAVDKFLNIKLALDQTQFEIMAVDQNKFKELLKETSQVTAQEVMRGTARQSMPFTSDSQAITSGLYNVTLTSPEVPGESYDLVLNAKDGDVLKIQRSYRESRAMPRHSEETVFDLADRFVEEHGSYPLSELTSQPDMTTRWGSNAELYYTSKDNKTVKYCVVVHVGSNKVVGFSKDVMALLNYNSRR